MVLGLDALALSIAPHRDAPCPALSTIGGGAIVALESEKVALGNAIAELGQLLLREPFWGLGPGGAVDSGAGYLAIFADNGDTRCAVGVDSLVLQ